MRDNYLLKSFAEYQKAHAERITLDLLLDGDPRQNQAQEREDEAFIKFLNGQAQTHRGLLLKLKLAFEYENYWENAIDPSSKLVAPRCLTALLFDLEHLVFRQ